MTNSSSFEKAKILFQEGLVDFQNEKYEKAEINFLESLKLLPNRLSTIQNLISTYAATEQKKKLKETLESYKHLNNEKEILYGIAYDHFFEENYIKSIEICENLIKFEKFRYSSFDLLASNFKKQKLFLKALKVYKQKIREKKDYLIYYNIGCLFFDLGRVRQALYYFKKSKDLKSSNNATLWNLSLCYLTLGNLDNGFSLYEYRWLKKNNPLTKKFDNIKIPSKNDEIKDKNILISDEQGLGDTVNFSRFVIELLRFTKKITFVVNPKLTELLSNLSEDINVVDYENFKPKKIDYHIPLCSLPRFLNVKNFDDINFYPLNIKRKKITNIQKDKINIGLAWSGNPNFYLDEYRSIPFKNFEPILNIKNTNFFKLSQSPKVKEFQGDIIKSNLLDLGDKSIFEISQVMQELDLVVSSDTSIIHLAGILNIKSILLLNYNSEWRWFKDETKTVWYPSVDIIKQKKFHSWDKVFLELKSRIEKLILETKKDNKN